MMLEMQAQRQYILRNNLISYAVMSRYIPGQQLGSGTRVGVFAEVPVVDGDNDNAGWESD